MSTAATDVNEGAPPPAASVSFTFPAPAEVLDMDREAITPIAEALGVPVKGKIAAVRSAVLVALANDANDRAGGEPGALIMDALSNLTAAVADVGALSRAAHSIAVQARETAATAPPVAAPAAPVAHVSEVVRLHPVGAPTPPPDATNAASGVNAAGANIRLPDGFAGPPPGAFGPQTSRAQINPPHSVTGGTAHHLPDGWAPPAEHAGPPLPPPAAAPVGAAQRPDGAPQPAENTPALRVQGILHALAEVRDEWRRQLPAGHPAREAVLMRVQNAVGAVDTLSQYLHTNPI